MGEMLMDTLLFCKRILMCDGSAILRMMVASDSKRNLPESLATHLPADCH